MVSAVLGKESDIYPLVAVIIAVYKGDTLEFFAQAIDSLRQQSYPRERVKIILGVDGPLRDEVDQYINENSSIFYIISRSECNMGLASTLNRIIPQALHFDFVARMDADDIAHQERIISQVRYLSEHAEVGILGTAIIEFDEQRSYPARFYPDASNVRRTICRGSPLAHPSVMYRSSALKMLGGYPNVRGNEDIAMWFKAVNIGIIIDNLSVPLLYFRVSSGVWGRRGFSKAYGELKVYARGLIELSANPLLLLFPMARFIYRCLPQSLRQAVFKMIWFRNRLQS